MKVSVFLAKHLASLSSFIDHMMLDLPVLWLRNCKKPQELARRLRDSALLQRIKMCD